MISQEKRTPPKKQRKNDRRTQNKSRKQLFSTFLLHFVFALQIPENPQVLRKYVGSSIICFQKFHEHKI